MRRVTRLKQKPKPREATDDPKHPCGTRNTGTWNMLVKTNNRPRLFPLAARLRDEALTIRSQTNLLCPWNLLPGAGTIDPTQGGGA